jgi:hypothetical protein
MAIEQPFVSDNVSDHVSLTAKIGQYISMVSTFRTFGLRQSIRQSEDGNDMAVLSPEVRHNEINLDDIA